MPEYLPSMCTVMGLTALQNQIITLKMINYSSKENLKFVKRQEVPLHLLLNCSWLTKFSFKNKRVNQYTTMEDF